MCDPAKNMPRNCSAHTFAACAGRIAGAAPLSPLIGARQEEAAVCNAHPSPNTRRYYNHIDSAGTMVSINLLVLGMILV